jgi:hypothetical protein
VDSAQGAVRDVVLIVVSGAYVVFSLVLALVLGLTVLLHGVSTSACLAIAVVWLVPTYLFARLRRRNARLWRACRSPRVTGSRRKGGANREVHTGCAPAPLESAEFRRALSLGLDERAVNEVAPETA